MSNVLHAMCLGAISPLMGFPAELRVQIFAWIHELPSETTLIDVQSPTPVQRTGHSCADALKLTCKKIREECTGLRRYQIIAPIFGDSSGPLHPTNRSLVASALMATATNKDRARQLGRSTIFLGYMGSIQRLHWMEMHSCLIRVLEAIMLIREHAPGLTLSVRLSIEGGAVAQYAFGIRDASDVENGMSHGTTRDGSPVLLTATEAERLKKITKTLARTMFPDPKTDAVGNKYGVPPPLLAV